MRSERGRCKVCRFVRLRTPLACLDTLMAAVAAVTTKRPSAEALARLHMVQRIAVQERVGTCLLCDQRLLHAAVKLLGREGAAAQVADVWLHWRICLGYEPGAKGGRVD